MNPSIVAALLPVLIVALIIVVICRKMGRKKGMITAHAPPSRQPRVRFAMSALGVISIAVAGMGVRYNVRTISADFSSIMIQQNMPYFCPAFYIMSSLCLTCYIILLICGVQFLRSRTNLVRLFIGTVIFEVVCFFGTVALWMIPGIGVSVAAATGVACGGMSYQIYTLFPLWAPFVTRWAVIAGRDLAAPGHDGVRL